MKPEVHFSPNRLRIMLNFCKLNYNSLKKSFISAYKNKEQERLSI